MRRLVAIVLAAALLLAPLPAQAAAYLRQEGGAVYVGFLLVNLNSATTDHAISVPFAKYLVRRVTVYEASTSLGASAATFGVFTATGGGGTTVVADATLTGLTAATKFVDSTVATSADYLTAATLYARTGTAHGSAATVSVRLELQPIP